MRYRVMVNIPFGFDDTLDAEFSGRIFEKESEAIAEMEIAERDYPEINYAWIDEWEA